LFNPSSVPSNGDLGLSFDSASLKLRRASRAFTAELEKYQDERGEGQNERGNTRLILRLFMVLE